MLEQKQNSCEKAPLNRIPTVLYIHKHTQNNWQNCFMTGSGWIDAEQKHSEKFPCCLKNIRLHVQRSCIREPFERCQQLWLFINDYQHIMPNVHLRNKNLKLKKGAGLHFPPCIPSLNTRQTASFHPLKRVTFKVSSLNRIPCSPHKQVFNGFRSVQRQPRKPSMCLSYDGILILLTT